MSVTICPLCALELDPDEASEDCEWCGWNIRREPTTNDRLARLLDETREDPRNLDNDECIRRIRHLLATEADAIRAPEMTAAKSGRSSGLSSEDEALAQGIEDNAAAVGAQKCERCGNPLSEHDDPTLACPAWTPEEGER